MIEHPFELRIGIISELRNPRRPLPLSEQDHPVRGKTHDLVGIDEVAGRDVFR